MILALKKSPTQKKKTRIPCRRHRCGASQILSKGQVRNILATLECQRGVNYAYLDVMGHWGFYSSEVLPPFLVAQVVSLQTKSFPCRTLLLGIQNVVDKLFFREESMVLRCFSKILLMLCPILIGPLFYQGFHSKDGLDFLLAHGHRPVKPTRLGPSGLAFCFYPLQHLINHLA